jgi:molecular chaperone HtpG
MARMSDHRFQVDLTGIIDLLSHHLYSGPQVFVRELLQNAVDAIRARRAEDGKFEGRIEVELAGGSTPTLVFSDNGIGLSEKEIHSFLSTIGSSSKRGDLLERKVDFIGQFGIGILSCFMVSDEIAVVTRSCRSGSRPQEWRGRGDGTYSVRTLEAEVEPGTRVYLRARPGAEEWFDSEKVAGLIRRFGGFLPEPVLLRRGDSLVRLSQEEAPWNISSQDRLLELGRGAFEEEFVDVVPLRSTAGGVQGAAFVLARSPNLAARRSDRVYLKNMLLSDSAEGLLPDWAFFVRCIVNTTRLRPTADRESFFEDDLLDRTREELGGSLRDWLVDLARRHPDRLRALIRLHHLAFKTLALHDEEFFRIVAGWLPFETSLGEMSLQEALKHAPEIRYALTVDEFRQVMRVAQAENLCVINGGYVHGAELLEKYGELFPDVPVSAVDASTITRELKELDLKDQESAHEFLLTADAVLRRFDCRADLKSFQPSDLPALYSIDETAAFHRSVQESKDVSSEHWGAVLDALRETPEESRLATLCFNFSNPLVTRLCKVKNRDRVALFVQTLYVQALLLGHRPLRPPEYKILNDGLLRLLELGLEARP